MRDYCSSAVQAIRSSMTSSLQAEHNRLFHRQTNAEHSFRRGDRKSPGHSRKRPRNWTHLFICLGSNTVRKWISADRLDRQMAGLGERTIEFEEYESIDSSAFRHRLYKEYPKLADGGGYELMRLPPNSRTLEIIQPPAEGYTPLFLSRVMGTSRTFIRPISRSLNMSKVIADRQNIFVAIIYRRVFVV